MSEIYGYDKNIYETSISGNNDYSIKSAETHNYSINFDKKYLLKEIDRLNNIIDETKNIIEFELHDILIHPKYENHIHSIDGLIIKRILNKLKELK